MPAPPGAAAVRLESGEDLVAVVRALDAADVAVADLQLHQPSLDDVFLAKTGRKLEDGGRRSRGGRAGVILQQSFEMARRSILQTLRQPAMVIPPVLFPLVLMGINVGGLDAATNIPGFPTDSYLDFAIAFPFIQGSLFASINAGSAVARDVETGFLNRLALTPMQRAAMLLGNLSGVMVVALISSLIYLAVGLRRRPALRDRRARRARAARAGAADRARVRVARARSSGCAPARAKRSRASSRSSSSSCSCRRARCRAS